MREYVVNRPDEAAMTRLLEENRMNPAGTILRLAWLQGLLRDEIVRLTWGQISFLDRQIVLPDRTVPLDGEMPAYLEAMHQKWSAVSPYVLFSERYRKQMLPESVSRLARRALDEAGQTAVRLIDLRHDYVVRQLRSHDWAYVSRVTGITIPALQVHFAAALPEKDRTLRVEREAAPQVDEFKLWKVLQAEKRTPAGLAMWMAWQMGVQSQEMAALTWDQTDLENGVLHLPDRDVTITNAVRRLLADEQARRSGGEDPHVLLSVRSRKPMDVQRLSKLVRAALIRGGMDQLTLRDLRRDEGRLREEDRVLARVREDGPISRGEVMELLGLSKTAVYARLRRMTEEKKLVRIGGKYYLPGTVVPPEEHGAVIREYLTREGFAYRKDIADILHVQSKQCTQILKHLVQSGELVQVKQKYYLKEA